MSETLRDLVVSLSLQTDNFTRNIKSVNKQIAEAESKFRLAAAGVEGFERTTTGLSTQLSTLQRRMSLQQQAVTQYERALAAANSKLQAVSYTHLDVYKRQDKPFLIWYATRTNGLPPIIKKRRLPISISANKCV